MAEQGEKAEGTQEAIGQEGAQELAQTAQADGPAAEEPLFSATYDTTLELLAHYVDLLVGKKQKTFSIAIAFVDVALALAIAFAAPSAWPLALLLVVIGFGMLWYRGNAARMHAKKIMARLDPADAHRTVNVYDARVELRRATGDAYEYPVSELTSVSSDGSLLVLDFAREGVTVPASGMTKGSFAQLVSWANAQVAQRSPKAAR